MLELPLSPDRAARVLAMALKELGGKGSGNFGHSGRPGQKGGSGEGDGSDKAAPKVRNERSQRALKHFKPIHALAQRHAEARELEVRKMVGGIRTDDNKPVDVITTIDGKTKGIEVKVMLNNTNDKITMRKGALEKKDAWARSNHASVHTVVIDDRQKFGHSHYSGHRLYYAKGTGSFRLGSMTKVTGAAHLKALLAGKSLKELGGAGSGNFGHEGRPGQIGGSSSEGGGGQEEGVTSAAIVVTKKQKHTKDQIEKAWEMKQAGATMSKIQKETGLHPSTQIHHFKKMQQAKQEVKTELQKPSTKSPSLYYWKKNPETGKYEKTLTSAGKAAALKEVKEIIESKKELPAHPDLVADPEQSLDPEAEAIIKSWDKPATQTSSGMVADAEKYGYKWQEKTTGPQAGKYAWFKDGVQVSAPHDKSEGDKAAATMHYGQGPTKPEVVEIGPTPAGWPISNDVSRVMGSSYPAKVEAVGKQWTSKLPLAETTAIENYTGSGYNPINQALRENPTQLSPTAAKIQSALAKAPSPPPPELVWRGLGNSGATAMSKLSAGDQIRLTGFQSTSINPEFAKTWGGKLIFEIKPKAGGYVRPISQHKGEYEFLLPHNKEYKVHGSTYVKMGSKHVRVVQLEML